MRRCDYHTHTPLCHHAEGEPEAFIQQALHLGLSEYGITDHAPSPGDQAPLDDWRMDESDLILYDEWIYRAKKAAKGTALRVLAGLECDWLPDCSTWIQSLRGRTKWDYLIGSVHYISDGEAFDSPIYSDKSPSDSIEGDWRAYWQRQAEMVRSGLFDMIGHCDLIKIWKRYPEGDLQAYYEDFLLALREVPTVVELNAAGWHKPCAEQYPCRDLLRALLQQGTPICINSDAHSPQQLSRNWEDALCLLQELALGNLKQQLTTLRNGTQLTTFGI